MASEDRVQAGGKNKIGFSHKYGERITWPVLKLLGTDCCHQLPFQGRIATIRALFFLRCIIAFFSNYDLRNRYAET